MASLVYNAVDLALATGDGLLIGRNGSTELGTMIHGTKNASRQLLECAGVWEASSRDLESWIISSRCASSDADVLATGWYHGLAALEKHLLGVIGFLGQEIELRNIEPYYYEEPLQWTRLLAGVDVCVVSPFYKSVLAGYRERDRIWPNSLLPEFGSLSIVRSYFAPSVGGETHSWRSGWEEAVDYMEAEVLKTGARVVLIGCGGLGMILGARLKKKGLICIVMGGALQVLFGIKGKRWAHHGIIRGFWNDAWITPLHEEIPPGGQLIEGGCYW